MVWAVVTVGVVLVSVGIGVWVVGRKTQREAPRSAHLHTAAGAAGLVSMGLLGVVLALVTDLRGEAVLALFGLMLAPTLALLAGSQVLQLVERRRDRAWRRTVGLPTLRRRLHWGWAVAVGYVGTPLVAAGVIWAMAYLSVYVMVPAGIWTSDDFQEASTSDSGVATGVVVLLGTPALLGVLQAWRRRVRDREIQDADLAAAGLTFTGYRPPTWMPIAMGRTWSQLRAALDEPVPAGRERVTIAIALVVPALMLAIAAWMAWTLAAPGAEGDVAPFMRAMLALLACVSGLLMTAALSPTLAQGARTALRQLRHLRRSTSADEDDAMDGPTSA